MDDTTAQEWAEQNFGSANLRHRRRTRRLVQSAAEVQPEAPAEQVATAAEIEVLRAWHKHDAGNLTVREFVRGVAKLGGFLGRKHDGQPGVLTLWRGYQRLQDMLQG